MLVHNEAEVEVGRGGGWTFVFNTICRIRGERE